MSEPPYRLAFDRVLKRQVEQLPGKLRQEVRQLIAALAQEPHPGNARELRGYPNVYRCWLSDARYRLIWEVDDALRRVKSIMSVESPIMANCLGSRSRQKNEL
jgi:mRNA-degrading endonuclease RelE of RelBE toxin-antitoxin system